MPSTKIERIETFACSIPLDQPMNLGTYVVVSREYAVVRVVTSGGLVGAAVGLTRRAPVDMAAAEVLAPVLIGQDALDLMSCLRAIDRVTGGMDRTGIIGRARSLLDIALHDIRARSMGIPLWRLLGGTSEPVDVLLVEGYPIANEPDGKIVDRLLGRVEQGYRRLKIETGSYDRPEKLFQVLEGFRRQSASTRIILDGLWRWKSPEQASRYLSSLRAFDIDWIEDPFPVELIDCYRRFQRFERVVPVGAGDDLTDCRDIEALMDSPVNVVRLDALAIGGVTAFGELAAVAKKRGCRVSPHIYPHVHQHCVFGWGASDHVEMIPSDRSFDRIHELVQHDPFARVKNGRLEAPNVIGAGFDLNDKAVEKFARRKTVAG